MIQNDFGEELMVALIPELPLDPEKFSSFFKNPQKAMELYKNRSSELSSFIWSQYNSIYSEEGMEAAYRWSSFLFSGHPPDQLRDFSQKTWQKCLSSQKISVFPEILDLVDFLRANHWEAVIVTASPTVGIRAIANHVHVPEDKVLGMDLDIQNGILTETILEPFTYGSGKVSKLALHKNKNADLSFGDSINDLPLLKSAQKLGILIERNDPAFTESCKSSGIRIQKRFL